MPDASARPETRRVDQTDDFFGTPVADPYRWLEDTDDAEVASWLKEQAASTREQLDALPGRTAITAALDRAVRLPHSGLPVHRGKWWFRLANDGVQQQDVLLLSEEPFGAARTLIDPNLLGGDLSTSLAVARPSPDGTLVAYSYSEAGSDWRTWRVHEVATGTDLADEVRWSKFGWPVWLPDGTGFFYDRFDPPPEGDAYVARNDPGRIELHRLGTEQDADELVFALPDEPETTSWAEITDDGRWLVIVATKGTEHAGRVWVRELAGDDETLRPIVPEPTANWQLLGSVDDELVMITDLDAPRCRVVALSATDGSVRELVAEAADRLESGAVAGGRLLLHWLRDAAARLSVHDLDGAPLHDVDLPSLGSIEGIEARESEPLAHLAWSTFTDPDSVLAYDVETGELSVAFDTDLSSDLVTEQIWVTSADGTRLPVFLVHRPDVGQDNGPHPAWLYGYGGFRIAMTPSFDATRFAYASAGGVVAVACLRGGGEYGTAWHDDGRLANKQHVFDDAIATAEHLISTGWTDRSQLGLSGRSNGGLLAGAVLTQRPDLFAAVIPEVGVHDLLRFPLWTIGWAWTSDYGDPRADEEQFRTVYAYSPLHNLRADVAYPPVLVMTSDHDDRVVPAHSIKFAAQLQAVSPREAIALLRVESSGGHGLGRSHDALVAERTDFLAFLSRYTGLAWQ
ncbi:MAG TPA: prolyl oligopeptidase family serine peptidase [Jatrophihabitantaceae bacterium]